MSLARKYRIRFATQRGDRLVLYLTTAFAFHAGIATAGWVAWTEQREAIADAPTPQPIELVYLDADDAQASAANRFAQSSAEAAGEHRFDLPRNAGKTELAPQKATVSDSKPTDEVTTVLHGEIVPAQHSPPETESGAIAASSGDLAKAVEPIDPLPLTPETLPILQGTHEPQLETPPTMAAAPPAVEPSEAMLGAGHAEDSPSMPLSGAAPIPATSGSAPTAEDPEVIAEVVPETEVPIPVEPAQDQDSEATVAAIATDQGLDGLPNADPNANEEAPPQLSAQEDPVLGDYIAQLNERIYAMWAQVELEHSEVATVRFVVAPAGDLLEADIVEAAPSSAANQAALDAVQQAAPFAPLPEAYQAMPLAIRIQFNYTLTESAQASE